MSTLAQLRDRVEQALVDGTNAIFTADMIDEAMRQALTEYNLVRPLENETVLTLPGAGREIALDSLGGLAEVTQVWWPYSSLAGCWPPNQVRGYRLYWDDGRPVLFLTRVDGGEPQAGDELRLWYTTGQKIEGLDLAAATSLPAEHEGLLVAGAAGFAAMARTVDLIETIDADMIQVSILGTWASRQIRDYRQKLGELRSSGARSGPSWGAGWMGAGWVLDKWDRSG